MPAERLVVRPGYLHVADRAEVAALRAIAVEILQRVARQLQLVLVAPIGKLLEPGLLVKRRIDVVIIATYFRRLRADVHYQSRQKRSQIVAF